MATASLYSRTSRPNLGWPLLMAFIRLPLGLTGYAAVVLAYRFAGHDYGLTPALGWSPLIITLVNLISLSLLLWRGRVEGFRLRDLAGFRWRRLPVDLILGVVWSTLLLIPLGAGVLGVSLLVAGVEGLTSGEAFIGGANFNFDIPVWVAYVSAIVFPLLNAPIEELQYRGYAQPRLIDALGGKWRGLLLPAAGFGLQHMIFAITPAAALAYSLGFFLWGIGAGLIARRQRRLAQLIVAHFISNLFFGAIPLVFVLFGS